MTQRRIINSLLSLVVVFSAGYARAQSPSFNQKHSLVSPKPFSTIGPNLPVLGNGTVGRLAKWTGLASSNSFIGETTIFANKLGSVGIGTDTPSSRLTVAGLIETTLGGIKFPDGTIQTTAGVAAIFHDASLMANGTSGSPLGIALGGVQTVHLANGAVTAAKI